MLTAIARELLENEKIKNHTLIVGVSTAALTLGTVLMLQHSMSRKNDGIATVPYKWPVFGSTRDYNKDEYQFVKSTSEKYGPVYRAHLFGKIVTIVGAGHAEEVFTHPGMSFIVSQQKKFEAAHFFEGYLLKNLPPSVISDTIVRELNPKLKHYTPRAYAEYKNVMCCQLGDSDEEYTVLKDMTPLIVQCISQGWLSILFGPEACKNTPLAITFSSMFGALAGEFKLNIWHQVFPWYHEKYMEWSYPRWEDMRKHRQAIKSVIKNELAQRLCQKTEHDDLFQYVLKLHPQENSEENVESLTTFIEIMFFVGVLTTVGSTIGIINHITNDASMIKTLREEQEQALDDEICELQQSESLPKDASAIDRGEVLMRRSANIYRRLAKLDSFIRESFRYGTRSLAHAHTNISGKDIVLKSGAIIRPGEEVYINLWHVHQQLKENQNDYNESIEEFKPFRHVGHQTPATKAGEDYMLFGMGRHACPGRWFAIHQIKGLISCLIRNYDMTVIDPEGSIRFEARKT